MKFYFQHKIYKLIWWHLKWCTWYLPMLRIKHWKTWNKQIICFLAILNIQCISITNTSCYIFTLCEVNDANVKYCIFLAKWNYILFMHGNKQNKKWCNLTKLGFQLINVHGAIILPKNVWIAEHQDYWPGHLMTKLLWKFGQNPLRNVGGVAHGRNCFSLPDHSPI